MVYPPHVHRAFIDRLSDSWRDLAEYLEIPRLDQRRWARGYESMDIWDWLKSRQRLTELPGALAAISRNDLADLLNDVAARFSTTPVDVSAAAAAEADTDAPAEPGSVRTTGQPTFADRAWSVRPRPITGDTAAGEPMGSPVPRPSRPALIQPPRADRIWDQSHVVPSRDAVEPAGQPTEEETADPWSAVTEPPRPWATVEPSVDPWGTREP